MENLTLRAAHTNQPHYVEEASLTSPCQHELWVSSRRPWRRMQQVPAGAVRIYYVYSMKLVLIGTVAAGIVIRILPYIDHYHVKRKVIIEKKTLIVRCFVILHHYLLLERSIETISATRKEIFL